MVSNVSRLAESIQDKISEFNEMMLTLKDMENKHVKQYTSVFSDSVIGRGPGHTEKISEGIKNRKRKERKQKKHKNQQNAQSEANRKHIKNLSDIELNNNEIHLLVKGLKHIPCPVTNETRIRQQLLRNFEDFARKMRLRYIYHGHVKE